MIKVKAMVGVCAICALAFGALAVQDAAGAIKGTTGFTCKEKAEPGGAGFSRAHCAAADAVETGAKFEHVAIPENVVTEGRVTNTNTRGEHVTARLVSVFGGVEEEFQAKQVLGEATGKNTKNTEGEHFMEGTGKTIYSEITVTKPAGKGCKVKGEEVVTKELRGTSLGQGMEGKLEPVAGSVFAEFTIEGCTIAALNGVYKAEGSIKCPNDGATVLCTVPATKALGTLKLRGQTAGLEVETTATARASSSEAFTPVAPTTIETP